MYKVVTRFTVIVLIAMLFSASALALDASASAVTDLKTSDIGDTWLNWTWINPVDSDFDYTIIYINNIENGTADNNTNYYNVTGLEPITSYEFSTRTVNITGNISLLWVNKTAITLGALDITPPASVTNLTAITGSTWINWTWIKPIDTDFNHTIVYLDNVEKGLVNNTTNFYMAINLTENTTYKFSTKTVDIATNTNSSWINATEKTLVAPDTTPPASITNLSATSGEDWIHWTWNNPNDDDFNHVEIFVDGLYSFSANLNSYNMPSLTTDKEYTISIRTVDNVGNINSTFVNLSKSTTLMPSASFIVNETSGKEPLAILFTDTSSGANSHYWDFGDNTNSTERNPTHTYNVPGTYNVSLNVSNEYGYDYILQQDHITVLVLPAPVALFNANKDSGTHPLTVTFTDQSTDAASWEWNFGDGITSTAQSPSHTYTTAGSYTVSLNVSNINGSDIKRYNVTTKHNYVTVTNPTTTSTSTGGSGSGGGGGGSSATSEEYENIALKDVTVWHLVKDVERSFTFSNEEIEITYINVTTDLNIGSVKAIIESLHSTSSLIPKDPEGRVYKNINIWLGDSGLERRIISSSIGFRVERTWLKDNSVPEHSVTLSRYQAGNWVTLPTNKISEDDQYIYYEAEPSGKIFSAFAIIEPVKAESIPVSTSEEVVAGQQDNAEVVKTAPSVDITEEGSEIPTAAGSSSKRSMVKIILIALPLIVLISGSYIAVTKGYHTVAQEKLVVLLEELKAEKMKNGISSSAQNGLNSEGDSRPSEVKRSPMVNVTEADVQDKIRKLEESGIISNVNRKQK